MDNSCYEEEDCNEKVKFFSDGTFRFYLPDCESTWPMWLEIPKFRMLETEKEFVRNAHAHGVEQGKIDIDIYLSWEESEQIKDKFGF
jgi:hypothetical protein